MDSFFLRSRNGFSYTLKPPEYAGLKNQLIVNAEREQTMFRFVSFYISNIIWK